MPNPFEDDGATYLVLTNDEGQYSLWPVFADVPAGWATVHPPASLGTCLAYVNEQWTDQRPKSVARTAQRA